MRKPMRLGIMGGTFDPIHFGHLVTADEALVQYNLDKVIFMPTGSPARKSEVSVTSAEHRYLMAVIATSANPDFDVSRLEIDRVGLTYTIDTILALRDSVGPKVEIYFITGADAVWEIATWKDADRFQGLCTFISATRPGYDINAAIEEHAQSLASLSVEFIEVPALAISSTDIRDRVGSRRPIRYLTPEPVVAYIHKYGLYQKVY